MSHYYCGPRHHAAPSAAQFVSLFNFALIMKGSWLQPLHRLCGHLRCPEMPEAKSTWILWVQRPAPQKHRPQRRAVPQPRQTRSRRPPERAAVQPSTPVVRPLLCHVPAVNGGQKRTSGRPSAPSLAATLQWLLSHNATYLSMRFTKSCILNVLIRLNNFAAQHHDRLGVARPSAGALKPADAHASQQRLQDWVSRLSDSLTARLVM